MALSFFCEKHNIPPEEEVNSILGKAANYWMGIKKHIEGYGTVIEEWKLYSQKAGWCKKLLLTASREDRNIIFLYPNEEVITGVLVYGEKAVEAARQSTIPDRILDQILQAKPYREGRSFQVEIRNMDDFEILKKLVDIKIQQI